MKKSIFSFIIILISFSLYAQSDWKRVNNFVNLEPYNLFFINSNVGFAVGEGYIYKTIDGGTTWNEKSSNVVDGFGGYAYKSIFFINDTIGFACSGYGRALKTIDAGESWIILTTNSTNNFHSVNFISPDTGWIVGDASILKTTDGGTTWVEQLFNGNYSFESIYITSNLECIVVGTDYTSGESGLILKTIDGGLTWTNHSAMVNNSLKSVYFTNSTNGYAVGWYGSIYKTSDAGLNWSSVSSTASGILYDVAFTSPQDGYIVGNGGQFYTTNDGGITWNENNYIGYTNKTLYSVFPISNSEIFVASDGAILKTTDMGSTWDRLYDGSGFGFQSVKVFNENKVMALSYQGRFLNTEDAGQNWISKNIPDFMNDFDFVSDSIGWFVRDGNSIIKTIDGGNNWIYQSASTTENLLGVEFINENIGWAIGNQTVLHTIDGGNNWSFVNVGINDVFRDVFFLNDSIGWITGEQGTILKTIDAGVNWENQSFSTSQFIQSIRFYSAEIGYAVGSNGLILKTNDGGINWIDQSINTTNYFNSVEIIDENQAWVVGGGQTTLVLSTNNGGNTWTNNNVFNNIGGYNCIAFSDSLKNGWLFGSDGLILNYNVCQDTNAYNFFSLPSDSTCNGSFNLSFPLALNNSVSIDNSSYVEFSENISFDYLCPGIHDISIINNCGTTSNYQFVVPSFSNIILNNNFFDSTVVDSLGVVNSNCFIDYSSIDTAYIDSLWTNGNQVNVIWNIVDSNGSNLDTTTYNLNSGTGVYWLQLSVFCPTKAVDDYFTVTQAIYFGNGTATLGVDDNFSFHENNIGLYPNPTSNSITVTFTSNSTAHIQLMDAQGKLIQQNSIVSGQSVSLEELERGIYFISLEIDNQQYIERIIKQ